jgi:hypothetical protein
MRPLVRTADLQDSTPEPAGTGPRPSDRPDERPCLDVPTRRGPRLSRYLVTLPTLGLVAAVVGSAAIVVTCVTITLDAMAVATGLALFRRALPPGSIEDRATGGGEPSPSETRTPTAE